MKFDIIKADSRGKANHGWLQSNFSFSFAAYYDPKRVNFGALRVLNDDVVKPSTGFDTHPHRDMEIVTIPLTGALLHRDNTGNESIIKAGDVQIMSAGTGIFHSEHNASDTEDVELLQIWVFPKQKNLPPRYDQKEYTLKTNELNVLVSPDGTNGALQIFQNSWFTLGKFDSGHDTNYKLNDVGNGVYIFVIEGDLSVGGNQLNKRDAISIEGVKEINLNMQSDAQVLFIEVPMNV